MRRTRLHMLLPLLFFACHNSDQRAVEFSFRYQPGETYTYRIYDRVEIQSASSYEEPKQFEQYHVQKSQIIVLNQDSSGIYDLKITFSVEADSLWRIENNRRVLKPRPEILGRKSEYRLRMRSDGEIVDIKGKSEQATFFYERAYKTSQPVFPRGKIAPGYSWKQTVSINMPRNKSFTATTHYTFTGFARLDETECAVIEFVSDLVIETDLSDTPWNRKGHRRWDYHNVTKTTGKIYFDYQNGRMVRKQTTFHVDRRSSIIDREGNKKEEHREMVDYETIKLVCVHQDSVTLSAASPQK